MLVAVPVILGSIARIPLGIVTDRYGGRIVFTVFLFFLAVPLLLAGFATSYGMLLGVALILGVAGAVFAIGVPFVARWFPPARQGMALGVYGMGNVGTGGNMAAEAAAKRQQSVLDLVLADAQRLNAKLGAADKQRLDQYLTSVSELEGQLKAMPSAGCTAPSQPASGGNWHSKAKLFIDLAVTAMACDLTRVVTLQYSDSWGVNYSDYAIGEGKEALGDWSDHFISHKLDDNDRATDLDGLDRTEAMKIANARVVSTSRFKVRRFAYLVNALKSVATANGTLLDESLVLYASECGDGDSHARTKMPTLIAGHAGGFETGRAVSADKKTTGALHASLIARYGLDVTSYGSPAGTPITGL